MPDMDIPKPTIVAQHYPLFVVYLGADGDRCRVLPGVHAVTAWQHWGGPAVPEPIVLPLAGAQDPRDEAIVRRFFHSYDHAAAYIAQEQATPPHGAGH